MMEHKKKIGEEHGMSALRAQLKKAVADQGLSSGVDYNKMNFGTVHPVQSCAEPSDLLSESLVTILNAGCLVRGSRHLGSERGQNRGITPSRLQQLRLP